MKKKKRPMTKYEKEMLIKGIGVFILGILLAPVWQGLACLVCIMAEL